MVAGEGSTQTTHGWVEGERMSWYEIDLPVDDELPEQAARLTDEFDALFLAAGCPQGMALFAARAAEDKVAFYFSPDAARYAHEVIGQFHGWACAAPPRQNLELVEGKSNPAPLGFSPRAAIKRAAIAAGI